MASGIKDKVAILGMGCSKFGERWESGAEELMVEAYLEALQDAGVETNQIQAAWFCTAIEEQHVGKGGTPLSVALRLPNIPGDAGREFLRVADPKRSAARSMRWRPGACDIALALGVEKLKDTGYGGLPQREGARLRRCGARTVRRPATSRSSPRPIAPSTASRRKTSSAPSPMFR